MPEDAPKETYPNEAGGNTYIYDINALAKQEAVELEKFPAVGIGPDRIVHRTPNFVIITGHKQYRDDSDPALDKNNTNFLRFYIVPVTDDEHKEDQSRAEYLLESAAQKHHIPTEFRLVRDHNGDTHMCPCVRFNFSEENWREYVKSDLGQPPIDIQPDTVPPLSYLQSRFDREEVEYKAATVQKLTDVLI